MRTDLRVVRVVRVAFQCVWKTRACACARVSFSTRLNDYPHYPHYPQIAKP